MRTSIISLALGLALSLGALYSVAAEDQQESSQIELQNNPPPPDRYVVVKGDTLWGISKRYLKNPWHWPDLWGMNKDEVKNPHKIYPGNVLVLDMSGGTPRLRLEEEGPGGLLEASRGTVVGSTVKLSARVRSEQLSALPIPSISATVLEPFLNRPLIVEQDQFNKSPRVVATQENRVVAGVGDTIYVDGLSPDSALVWQLYRPSKPLVDPITKEVLGYEVTYLGDARVREFGDITSMRVIVARQEIGTGDRLVMAPASDVLTYVPRAASANMKGRIISAPDNVISEIGQQQVVVINRGARDGTEVGHVFSMARTGPVVIPRAMPVSRSNEVNRAKLTSVYKELNSAENVKAVRLPDERYGLLFVFRVFEKVSYALVLNTTQPANLNDIVQAP